MWACPSPTQSGSSRPGRTGLDKPGYLYSFVRGNKFFELSNHLGNVLVVVSDRRKGVFSGSTLQYYTARVVSASDYAPFGMTLNGRTYTAASAGGYRYGFNGKENDKDINEGAQDYGMRIYDKRIGRFLSVDPLAMSYAFYSPYQFAGNSPIAAVDIDGGEPKDFKDNWQPRPMFNMATKEKVGTNKGYSFTVEDTDLKLIDVELVYDEWTQQVWFIHQDCVTQQYFYLKNDDGDNAVMTIVNGDIAPKIKGGHLEPFVTQDQIQARLSDNLVDGLGLFFAINLAISLSGGTGYMWLAEDALEEMAGVPIPDGPLDLMKYEMKKEARQEAEQFTIKSINKVDGTTNCVNCSIATDSYLKGFPASALNSAPKSLKVLEKQFGTEFTHNLNIDQVKNMVSQNGQMGIVFGNRGSGEVGHVFNVINQNGKINFIDGQTGMGADLSGYINFSFLPTK